MADATSPEAADRADEAPDLISHQLIPTLRSEDTSEVDQDEEGRTRQRTRLTQ